MTMASPSSLADYERFLTNVTGFEFITHKCAPDRGRAVFCASGKPVERVERNAFRAITGMRILTISALLSEDDMEINR